MKKLLSGLCASTLVLAFGLSTLAPASAAPAFVQKTGQTLTDIRNVQSGPNWLRNGNRVQNRVEQRNGRLERRGNQTYYNGHRGYSEPRRGYRQYNGMWFPAAAFIAGAIIGNQPRATGNSQVAWCSNRYKSYRASDNTFQPYNGPRQQCVPS